MLETISPVPSARRRTTAAAVSSQLVSIPKTSVSRSIAAIWSLAYGCGLMARGGSQSALRAFKAFMKKRAHL
jgi:hypothetical protein